MSTHPATLEAARLLLQQLGVSIDDLHQAPVAIPTIAEYLPTVIAASGSVLAAPTAATGTVSSPLSASGGSTR